jgi:hypothetical protein
MQSNQGTNAIDVATARGAPSAFRPRNAIWHPILHPKSSAVKLRLALPIPAALIKNAASMTQDIQLP